MIKLSGILKYSMGGFLCLRGFASFKLLSAISEPNPEVQRALIEQHKGEMARFLNNGEYRFFPEVILSLNLTDGKKDYDIIQEFHSQLQEGKTWNKNINGIHFSTSQNTTKNISNQFDNLPSIDRINITHIRLDENFHKLTRIDGNHRLSAADEIDNDFNVPYCLLLFQNPQENEQYSRAIFYNINAKQIPLNLEETLKVILESSSVFANNKLKNDPSFGWKYYLARKASQTIDFCKYPFIQALVRGNEYTYFLEVFECLLRTGRLVEVDSSIKQFVDELPAIEEALKEAQLKSLPQNLAVIGAISFYRLTDIQKYTYFLHWVKENCIVDTLNVHMSDLVMIFDKVYENTPKSIFMSMQFCEDTEDTYQTVEIVKGMLKKDNNIEFNLIRVDENGDGYSDEIYRRIVNGIESSSLVIADLSYGNRNVHHEIGYAQGLGKKVLLIYKQRPGVNPNDEIGSNLSMHDQLRFKNQTELRSKLLNKIKQYFGVVE